MDNGHDVYMISKSPVPKDKRTFYNSQIYTTPYFNRFTNETRNVFIGFSCQYMCEFNLDELRTTRKDGYEDFIDMQVLKLGELKHMSKVFKTPLLVIVNSFCDVADTKDIEYELVYHLDLTSNMKSNPNTKPKPKPKSK